MSGFDPRTLQPFTVIRCSVELDGDGERKEKRFLVIAHRDRHVICLKATSQVERYRSNEKILKGVLLYEAGECACFEHCTVIQPDNRFAISYDDLIGDAARRELQILGTLPKAKERLMAAVQSSFTMNAREREGFLKLLD